MSVIPGAPRQARWNRSRPRVDLSAQVVERIVRTAFPHARVFDMQPLADGLRNSNFRLRLDSAPYPLVLRIYEHDGALCQKELDLIRLVGGLVPVPEVIHAEPAGMEDVPPFTLARYVEGITFRDLRRSGDTALIAQAAYSIGEALAAIGRVTFPRAGWLAPGPSVTAPLLEGLNPAPRFVDLCLASPRLEPRLPATWRDAVHALVWEWASQLATLDHEAHLVHGDFNKRNILVRCAAGRWSVAAILDWEFAISGAPLYDLSNFLRYERASRPLAEPHFSAGYVHAGGRLPEGWRRLGRLLDLVAICESLTREDLPETIEAELVELVRATVEDRDIQLG